MPTIDNELKAFLSKPRIIEQFEKSYHLGESDEFFDAAFDKIVKILDAPKDSTILDLGCGSGAHSVRLARRGFLVKGLDFSELGLEKARQRIDFIGLDIHPRISLGRADITKLPFADGSCDYAMCWGVLMHIPNVQQAVSEICRVVRPGGRIVISENNLRSIQSTIRLILKRILKLGKSTLEETPAGAEYWSEDRDGLFIVRSTNIKWLMEKFSFHGCNLEVRRAGEFTDLYTVVSSSLLRRWIHKFNTFWFKSIRRPGLALGNILILKKEHSDV